jgi:hypothetical protein
MEPDTSARHAGSRFNAKVPCNCGLSYCDGWALRRTRLRHLSKAGLQSVYSDDDEEPGKPIVIPINGSRIMLTGATDLLSAGS